MALNWEGLSAMTAELIAPERWPRADAPEQRRQLVLLSRERELPPAYRAAALASARYGEALVQELPSLVNVGALALAIEATPRHVTHSLRPGATHLVHATDLHSLPEAAPRILRAPCIVESSRPDRPLFGATSSLACYPLGGVLFLVGVDYPDGARTSRWNPQWGERELDAGVEREVDTSLVDSVEAHHAWAREAARFLVVLGLLLDAEGAPIRKEDEHPKPRGKRGAASGPGPEWITRHVYLDERRPSGAPRAPSEPASAEHGDRLEQAVAVRGHVKRQRYGEAHAKTKWIWVEGYAARRWVAPRPVRIVVSTRE